MRYIPRVTAFVLISSACHGGDLSFGDPANVFPPPADAVGQAVRTPDFDVLPGFESPPRGFGNVAFHWWLGDKLTKERLQWQINQLAGKGVSGLQINYAHNDTGGQSFGLPFPSDPPLFSESWWDLCTWFVQAARKEGMAVSLSDYTLGTAGQGAYMDEVLERNPDLRGAVLAVQMHDVNGGTRHEFAVPANAVSVSVHRLVDGRIEPGSSIDLTHETRDGKVLRTLPEGRWLVCVVSSVVNPLSIDPMDPRAGKEVIKVFFQRFEDRNPGEAGKGLNFFFSDELQFGVGGKLWNKRFASEFKKRKGYDLVPELAALFLDIGPRTPKIRLDYSDVMVALQEEGFFKPLFDWHQKRGMTFGCDHGGRGRQVDEFGDYFRTQRWNQGPGADQPRLGKDIIKAKVAASIAHLYERPRVWLEGFYSSGWGTSSAEIADATFENFAMGFNLLTLHGLYYTTKGGWWEWAPPCNHFRMPYWKHMDGFMECVQRLSYLMTQGHHRCDVAIMYPVAAKEAGMDGDVAVQAAFGTGEMLYRSGIDFDFMDFESLARAEVRNGELRVGGAVYRSLVLPSMRAVRFSTLQKAVEFHEAGGQVIILGALPEASDRIGREDDMLVQMVAKLTTRAANPNEVLDLVAKGYTRDYQGPGSIQHRRIGPRDVYMIYGGKQGAECVFRATGKVELWNPWDGSSKSLPVISQNDATTTLKLPLSEKEVHLIVFSPGKALITEVVEPEPVVTKIEGDWEFELKPVLDNRFGDFHWPATHKLIGAEVRRLEYSESGSVNGPWRDVACGFGPKFWKLGPLPDDFDESKLIDLTHVDPTVPVVSSGKEYQWQPYEFSWRWGRQGDPGHQGYHGLKGSVTDQFICLGAPRGGKNETLYGPEPGGNRYYLWTSVPAEKAMTAYPEWGGMKPAAVWVNHRPAEGPAVLRAGSNPVLVRYDQAGRGYFVMSKSKVGISSDEAVFSRSAHWIWYPEPPTNAERWFKKRFELGSIPDKARLRITCDNSYVISINGREAGKGDDWKQVQESDVSGFLKQGVNEIVVHAGNTGDSAGLIVELLAGKTCVATDTTWEAALAADAKGVPAASLGVYQNSLWFRHPTGPPKVRLGSLAKPVFEDKPLAMKWWKNPAILAFDVSPQLVKPVGLYRFTAPPGFRGIRINAPGRLRVEADGKALKADSDGHFIVGSGFANPVSVLIRSELVRGAYAGEGLPEYLQLECGPGLMSPGDWARNHGLESYSGGALYRKNIRIEPGKRIILDLGNVVSSAEVHVNGRKAGVKTAPPWGFDISALVKPGENRIEVLVYNTLYNHYRSVPTSYNREAPSGLLGPVEVRSIP